MMIRKPIILIFMLVFLLGSVCSSLGAQNEIERVTLSDSYFQEGSADLQPAAAEILQKIYASLKADPDLGVRIEGYSNEPSTATENHTLAQQRVNAVVAWFGQHGLASERLEAKSMLPSNPSEGNPTEVAQAMKGKVEIVTVALKAPAVFFPETDYAFDPVVDGVSVIHDFVVYNKGDGLLKIERVRTG